MLRADSTKTCVRVVETVRIGGRVVSLQGIEIGAEGTPAKAVEDFRPAGS